MIATAPLVSLPMYDWPEFRDATDAFWAGLARHLGVAAKLNRDGAYDGLWRRPELWFSQTCGYPFTHEFRDLLQYVATPHYAADGCDGPLYRSILFAREKVALSGLRGARPAINSMDSMSGMLALRLTFAELSRSGEFLAAPFMSGSHLASLAAVQQGKADVCAVDCVCVALARRYRADTLSGLVEIARSPQVPGLPLVTRSGNVTVLRRGLQAAFADRSMAEVREKLMLADVSVLTPRAYDIIPQLEATL